MKKIIMFVAVLGLFTSFNVGSVSAACDEFNPCGNGPIVAQQPGGRFLKPGQEDCPAWFPYSGCYTMRTIGAFFYPLR